MNNNNNNNANSSSSSSASQSVVLTSQQTAFVSSSSLSTSSSANAVPAEISKVDPVDLAKFLKLVTEGEEDAAEAMLKVNPALALASGDVTDLSNRSFKNITGFQYAVWALDQRMWTMIQKYLPNDAASQQIKDAQQGSWVSTHGTDARGLIKNLEKALQKSFDLYASLKLAEGDRVLIKEVGAAQLLLPVHVVNEYCNPARSFVTCPDFTVVDLLQRSRKVDEGEWFTYKYEGGVLGEKFAYWRGHSEKVVQWCADWFPPHDMLRLDVTCVRALLNARTCQHENLVTELTKSHGQKLSAK